jgi:hypothetical protein
VSARRLSCGKSPESVCFVEMMERGLSLCDGASTPVANVGRSFEHRQLGAHHMVCASNFHETEASLR